MLENMSLPHISRATLNMVEIHTKPFSLLPKSALGVPQPYTCQLMSLQDPGDAWKFAQLESLRDMLVTAAEAGRFTPDPLIPFDLEPSEKVFSGFMAHYFHHA